MFQSCFSHRGAGRLTLSGIGVGDKGIEVRVAVIVIGELGVVNCEVGDGVAVGKGMGVLGRGGNSTPEVFDVGRTDAGTGVGIASAGWMMPRR